MPCGGLCVAKLTYGYGKIFIREYFDKLWYLDIWNQAMLMFRHMNLAMISVQSYHGHQSTFLFPAILKHWEVYYFSLIEEEKKSNEECEIFCYPLGK